MGKIERYCLKSIPSKSFPKTVMLNDSSDRDFLLKNMSPEHACVHVSCFVMSDSLRPYGLQPTRLLCPQTSPGKNTGVSCHSLLQGSFLTRGSNQVSCIASRLSEPPGKPPDPHQNMCYANITFCVFVYMHVLVFNAVFILCHNKKWCSIHFDLKRMVTIYGIESLCEVK